MPFRQQIPPKTRRIEILAFPGVQLLDVAGVLQVFATANEVSGDTRPYDVRVVANASLVVASSGLQIGCQALSGFRQSLDTLVLAGGAGVRKAANDKSLVDWIAGRATNARRTASVCSGAFLLGAAGLLDGKRAVTHWNDCAELARRHKSATIEVDPIYLRDGNLWTSAGVTAGIDMALAMVGEDLGPALATAIARELVVFVKRPGGQAQFSTALDFQGRSDAFEELHAWIAAHLDSKLSNPVLAEKMNMSERNFIRSYSSAIGMPPARAVQMMRLDTARSLLSSTDVSLKRIAQRCGFGSDESLRRAFHRHFGISPIAYRNRFTFPSDNE